jgi:hypothetical protein
MVIAIHIHKIAASIKNQFSLHQLKKYTHTINNAIIISRVSYLKLNLNEPVLNKFFIKNNYIINIKYINIYNYFMQIMIDYF